MPLLVPREVMKLPSDNVVRLSQANTPVRSTKCDGPHSITLWLFNIAMENGPFIDDVPIKTSIYKGFSMAMLNNQMVYNTIQVEVS